MPKRPNILFIMTDNQPAQSLGCYGNPDIQTPHLDQLAVGGTLFTNAHCVNAMCSPCRASVLTGLMPSQHGIHNWLDDNLVGSWPEGWSPLKGTPTLPQLLKGVGYHTALIGKYHLGSPFRAQLGFEEWVTLPVGHTTRFDGNAVIDNDERYTVPDHSVDFFGDKAADFIRSRTGKDNPFFAFVPLNGPYGHWPSIDGRGPEPFASLYDNCQMGSFPRKGVHPDVIARFAKRAQMGPVRDQFKGPLRIPNNLDALRNYAAQISLVDDVVGRLVAALKDQGVWDDTIVIFTADHGFSLGHQGIWGHGAASLPSTTHHAAFSVPLIFGGGIAGMECADRDDLVSQLDLFQTLVTCAGVDHPDETSDSRDIFSAAHRDAVFMEQEETRSIRTAEWLYMKRFIGAGAYPFANALYDLGSDPEEAANLAGHPDLQKIEASLSTQIDTYFKAYSDPRYDLWSGGSALSNSGSDYIWQDAFGADWAPHSPQA